MNKSAEDQAREYALHHSNAPDKETPDWIITDWLAGHQSRDSEVKKLVEVLEWVDNYTHTTMDDNRTVLLEIERRIEEALNPYQVTK